MQIIEQKVITSWEDLVRLHIIDWHRLNGTSPDIVHAIHATSSWLIGTTAYTVVKHDLTQAPVRQDFPQWDHVGNAHKRLAHLFWNDFKYHHPTSELIFSDEPDFYGTFKDGTKPIEIGQERYFWNDHLTTGIAHLWGDIGEVSASAFALTVIRKMEKGDLWISVPDDTHQIIIEALEDLQENFQIHVVEPLLGDSSERKTELLRQMVW